MRIARVLAWGMFVLALPLTIALMLGAFSYASATALMTKIQRAM